MTELVNVTAYIGTNYGNEDHTTKHVLETVSEIMNFYEIHDATFSECLEVWQGETEHSIRVEFIQVKKSAAVNTLRAACKALLQWEVLYTINGKDAYIAKDNAAKRRAARKASRAA